MARHRTPYVRPVSPAVAAALEIAHEKNLEYARREARARARDRTTARHTSRTPAR